MDKPIKKLNLNRETVKTLTVKAGVRTGADYSILAQGGVGGHPTGPLGSRGMTDTCTLGGIAGLGGAIFSGGLDRNGGH